MANLGLIEHYSHLRIIDVGRSRVLNAPFSKGLTFSRGLREKLLQETKSAYCGFDPTADSLHIGNLFSILVLIQLQKRGVTPIAVVGEATAPIGDPSGRLTERESLSSLGLERNVKGLEGNLSSVFENHQRYTEVPLSLLYA